ncbi:MAG: hypothetical protein CFE21_07070 [Bacteroidetes bacterium B1(2017)]|nr:MAG: hypothetical protein CFE21_07070 [Bacteroidetes bacterium B1(2017)]
MSKESLYKYLIIAIISLGGILRLTVFWVSPFNNSYDDHLEVIQFYSESFNLPAPFQCWECYQPPLYYYTCAAVYKIAESLGVDKLTCWKMVQFINPFLSIILIIIVYQILLLFKMPKLSIAVTLSFIVILPRDIFTSAMIGNDYMLVFFAILSFYLFLKTLFALRNGINVWIWFILLILSATLGSITKQHGLLIHLFSFSIFLVLCKKIYRKKLIFAIPILLIAILLSISNELWKFNQTGELLVSNQHYFDYAKNQFPGSIDKVEFFSFRIFELYQEPFISERTSASFFTELFARTFYDYEWRFISPKILWANTLGCLGYSLGLTWLFYFGIIVYSCIKDFKNSLFKLNWLTLFTKIPPILLGFLFMLVPFIQTLRYPYFSSMKSMFMLSGIILLLITLGSQIKKSSLNQQIGNYMIVLNIIYGIILVVSISIYLGISLNHLNGPLWPIP